MPLVFSLHQLQVMEEAAGETAPIMFTAAYAKIGLTMGKLEHWTDFFFQGVMATLSHLCSQCENSKMNTLLICSMVLHLFFFCWLLAWRYFYNFFVTDFEKNIVGVTINLFTKMQEVPETTTISNELVSSTEKKNHYSY